MRLTKTGRICCIFLFSVIVLISILIVVQPIKEKIEVNHNNKTIQEKKEKHSSLEKPYLAIKEQYPQIRYWIKIVKKGDKEPFVNLPVVVGDSEYYLTHTYDGKASKSGTLFFDKDTNAIYGHHMKNGTMFGALEENRGEIKTVTIDTIYNDGSFSSKTYKIKTCFWFNAEEKENDWDYNENIKLITCSYDFYNRFGIELTEI